MEVEIKNRGAYGSALVKISGDEEFFSEAGKMYRASDNVKFETTTRSEEGAGFFGKLKKGMKSVLAGESFFMSSYTSVDGKEAEVGIAPTMPGEVHRVDVGATNWICAGGSFLAAGGGVKVDTKYQGIIKGMFSKEGLFYLKTSGNGPLIVSAYGRITEIEAKDGVSIDNGHIVAFTEGLEYTVSKAAKGWMNSMLSGEGLVLTFKGSGKILVQSHDMERFGRAVGPKLPPKEA